MDILSPYQIMPALTEIEYETLKRDISENGVLLPILLDENGKTLDGHHRLQICEELHIKNYPVNVVVGLSENEKIALVISTNVIRRQLADEQRLALISKLYTEFRFSYRKIAEILGVSHETVRRKVAVVTHLTPGPEEASERVVGRDGKSYARHRATRVLAKSRMEAEETISKLKAIPIDQLPATMMDTRRLDRIIRDSETDRRRKLAQDMSTTFIPKLGDGISLRHGEFSTALDDINDGLVDLILTDPPYGKDTAVIWDALGQLAVRLLRPGGILVAYSGQFVLPDVLSTLSRHLDYVWMIALIGQGPSCAVHSRSVNSRFKPLLVFCKPPFRLTQWYSDVIQGDGPEKTHHNWQQGVREARHVIEEFTRAGDLVVDPMMGSGTTAVASLLCRREFIGCDKDSAAVIAAQERIQQANSMLEV
jgi:ParB-like chromosome segregation protein Spo0J